MLHHEPQTTKTMHLSWANLPDLKSSKNYLVYNRKRCLPYLGVNSVFVYFWVPVFVYWLFLLWVRFDPFWTLYVIKNYSIWSWQKCLSKKCLMPSFLVHSVSSYNSVIYFSLFQNTCTSSTVLLTPLQFLYAWSLSLKDVLTHPLSKNIQELASLPKVCRMLWWVVMLLLVLTLLFEWKILELHIFVNNCILSC